MMYFVYQMLLVKDSKQVCSMSDLWLSDVVSSPVSVGFQGIVRRIEGTEPEIDFTWYFMFQQANNMSVLEAVGNLRQEWEPCLLVIILTPNLHPNYLLYIRAIRN